MKVLLAAINAKYIHSNLAVYSLKAYAEKVLPEDAGISIELGEYTINQQLDEILSDIYKRKPDFLGLSCYIWNLSYVEEVIREIRKVLPQIQIWTGGPEVSYDSEDVLRRLPELDGVMKGEGEITLAEVLKALKEETSLADVAGISWKDADGIHENAWREVMDLSDVPFVYTDMKDFENKIVYYESSRGCPFRCSYCLSSVDKCLRFRSLDLVLPEIQFFLDHKVPQVKFVDRTFNCRHSHSMAIWQYILDHDNGITNFHFEVAADILNEEELLLIEKMRPGLIQLEIGVQSTNEDTIREIRRVMDFEKVGQIVKRINAYENTHQHLDLIAGLPYEDYESFGHSFDDVYSLQPEQLQLGFLKVLKGSYMEEQKKNYGLVYKNNPPYEVLYTNWLPYADVLRLKGVEEMTEVYYNSRQFCHTVPFLIEESGIRPFQFFEALADYYEKKDLYSRSHNRAARYEILLSFVKEKAAHLAEKARQLLTLDYYLRENAKNRPDFCGEELLTKEEARIFYDAEEEQRRFLKGYEGMDKRKMRKMTHLETFRYDVFGDMSEKKVTILFDYQNRSPINNQAAVFTVSKYICES